MRAGRELGRRAFSLRWESVGASRRWSGPLQPQVAFPLGEPPRRGPPRGGQRLSCSGFGGDGLPRQTYQGEQRNGIGNPVSHWPPPALLNLNQPLHAPTAAHMSSVEDS